MTLAIIHTRANVGIEAPPVTVEVHLSNGLPGLSIVGLPETAVKESKERVRSAILNSHLDFPTRRITINLAPADLPKEGGRYDLPIALGILAATNQIPPASVRDYEFIGELALSGELRAVQGILPAILACGQANKHCVLPQQNRNEAALTRKTTCHGAQHLLEVCAHLLGNTALPVIINNPLQNDFADNNPMENSYQQDLQDVIGQHHAKRALIIAAAGNHNLLFSGPPGTGKSMLAQRLAGIMPKLSEDYALEVAAIHSIAGHKTDDNFFSRPFRSPHHTSSPTALVGGGSSPKPGEISLAHRGVLFLDELPEFPRQALEVMREPMESGEITISRAKSQITYPASFQLIAAMNPCPCGYLGDSRCHCNGEQIRRYRQKISGPLLDRIDLQVAVSALPKGALTQQDQQPSQVTSATIRQTVTQAQQRQLSRQGKINAYLTRRELNTYCGINKKQQLWLDTVIERWQLSARGYHRILKVARTIADLENVKTLQNTHLSEAVGYRVKSK